MKYLSTTLRFTFMFIFLAALYGCDSAEVDETNGQSAQIIGSIAPSIAGKTGAACPEAIITINDVPATVEFLEDDECTFFISAVPVGEEVVIAVELVNDGLTGIVVLDDVFADELIEILIGADTNALTISVLRRIAPLVEGFLPERITENNIEIGLGAGLFDQDLTIDGNKVAVIGVSDFSCASDDWTTIAGEVTINGNKAIFQNVKFLSPVVVRGNKARFINTCFGDVMVSFGNDHNHRGDDDDD